MSSNKAIRSSFATRENEVVRGFGNGSNKTQKLFLKNTGSNPFHRCQAQQTGSIIFMELSTVSPQHGNMKVLPQ